MKGAEAIVRPSALLRSFDIWHITNAARAYDNHVYVVATNSFGHSMAVNPIAWRVGRSYRRKRASPWTPFWNTPSSPT